MENKCETHEEESQVEVCERCPREDKLDGVIEELNLVSEKYFIICMYNNTRMLT